MNFFKILLVCCICNTLFSQTPTFKTNLSKKTLDSLSVQLKSIFIKDQAFRSIYKEAEEKLGKDSEAMEYFWEVVEQQDAILEKQIITIIERYGWLSIAQVGRLGNTTLWAVLQHGSVASKMKYAPQLKASVLKKQSQPIHYARLIDRMRINSNKPQLYGTQVTYDSAGNSMFFPIETPELINQRRQELGLSPIQTFAKQKGISWIIKQKE